MIQGKTSVSDCVHGIGTGMYEYRTVQDDMRFSEIAYSMLLSGWVYYYYSSRLRGKG